jgi:acetyl-CoA acetyltransferase
MNNCLIRGAVEVPYARRTARTTPQLLAQAFGALLQEMGVDGSGIDGLGVASFTLRPDRCIDLAWKLGLKLRWAMDDGHGGASGLNLLQHAVAAIEAGQASNIVLLSGDAFHAGDFEDLVANYNCTTSELLRPLNVANPNSLFALLTQRHMAAHGLEARDYGELVIAQRRRAASNPSAVYRTPLSMDDYLGAPRVADPLVIYDCVPVVAGANAILVSHAREAGSRAGCVRVRSIESSYNVDHQEGDGLATGLRDAAPRLYERAGLQPRDMDLISVYDDYPVMSLVQLQDLGLVGAGGIRRFLRERVAADEVALNTSGGQLSAGQAGAAGGMHGLVEVIRQLSGRCGERQLARPRTGIVSGYGMVEYRWGMCANACILEACE